MQSHPVRLKPTVLAAIAAVELLASHGIDAVNVKGGIDAWSEQIDPSVPRY